MKRVLLPFFLILALSCPSAVVADEHQSISLMRDYQAALIINDPKEIVATWRKINADPDARAYMEKNSPWVASAYRLTAMSIKLSEDLAAYQANYPSSGTPTNVTVFASPAAIPLPTNEDLALRYPYEDQRSVQQTVQQRKQAPLIDNGAQTLNYPVQNERPNQDIIQSRVEHMLPSGQ